MRLNGFPVSLNLYLIQYTINPAVRTNVTAGR